MQAELCASVAGDIRLPSDDVVQPGVRSRHVSMDIGQDSVADTQSCVEGIQVMRLEQAEIIADDDDVQPAPLSLKAVNAVDELNATMSHMIDTACYPFVSEPEDQLLNASVMIDPSNPFDDEMIEKLLSKLAPPLTSYKSYHRVNDSAPKFSVRSSLQLGMFPSVQIVDIKCFVCCCKLYCLKSKCISCETWKVKCVRARVRMSSFCLVIPSSLKTSNLSRPSRKNWKCICCFRHCKIFPSVLFYDDKSNGGMEFCVVIYDRWRTIWNSVLSSNDGL